MTRFDACVVPGERMTCPGFTVTTGPLLTIGPTVAVKVTVPANPLVLFTRRVENAEDPCATVNKRGLAERPKSGGGAGPIVTGTATMCSILPLVPVTVKVYLPTVVFPPVVIVSLEEPAPVKREMVEGLRSMDEFHTLGEKLA